MAFIPVPNVAQVTVLQTLFGQEVNNVLHFARAGGWDASNLESLAGLVLASWTVNVIPEQSADLVLDGVRARDLSTADGLQVEVAPAEAVTGGVGQPSLPGNVAFCVTHRTAFIGRSRRGRTYVAGIGEDQVTGNSLAAPVASDLVLAFNTLRATTNASGYFFCVVSRFTNGDPRPEGISTVVTGSFAVDLRVDSQRGRLPA